jgi:broad-specificity NMP kinase
MRKPSFIYVTGISGSGKSAVCTELERRGYRAFQSDDLARFYNNHTGEPLTEYLSAEHRTDEWRAQHTWKLQRDVVEALRKESGGELTFLCGTAANDADELWDLFDRVFALTLDEATLRHRITTRTHNDYGKNPGEFASLLEWQKTAADDYTKLGATLVDATQPLKNVVDTILEQSK